MWNKTQRQTTALGVSARALQKVSPLMFAKIVFLDQFKGVYD